MPADHDDLEGAPMLSGSSAGGTFEADELYCGVPKSELYNTGEGGLSDLEARTRLTKFGRNELEESKENIYWKFVQGFTGPMPASK
jgi:hypothetical protein